MLRFLFILAVTLCTFESIAGEFTKVQINECRTIVSRIVKRQLNEFSTCIKEMEFKNKKDRARKLACIVKCVGIREKIIAPDGSFDQAHADEYMATEIPTEYLVIARPFLQKCFDMGVNHVDPKEELCHSYKPSIKCVMDEVTKLCEMNDVIATMN